jgi:hypothetical protein
MTLQEAKDQIAIKYGLASWASWNDRRTFPMTEAIQSEAAVLYAKSKWDEACDLARKTGPAKPEFKP